MYHNLSLDQTEIQYVMGHDMSSAPLDRKFYGSEEFLLNIYKKIQNHPLNKLFNCLVVIQELTKKQMLAKTSMISNLKYMIICLYR